MDNFFSVKTQRGRARQAGRNPSLQHAVTSLLSRNRLRKSGSVLKISPYLKSPLVYGRQDPPRRHARPTTCLLTCDASRPSTPPIAAPDRQDLRAARARTREAAAVASHSRRATHPHQGHNGQITPPTARRVEASRRRQPTRRRGEEEKKNCRVWRRAGSEVCLSLSPT
jgi:hypothetical protein